MLRLRNILIFCSVAMSSGCLDPPAGITRLSHQQKLQVGEDSLDLGQIWVTGRHLHRLRLTNSTNEVVSIKAVSASCSCTSIAPTTFQLNPAETQLLELTLDLNQSVSLKPHTRTPFKLELRIVFDDNSYQTLMLTGNILRPFVTDKTVFKFENPFKPNGDSHSITLNLPTHPELETLRVEAGDPLLTVAETHIDHQSNVATIVFCATSDSRLGRFSKQATIIGEIAGRLSGQPLEVKLVGKIQSDVDWNPQEIVLNSFDRALSEETITLSSRIGVLPVIESIECSDPRIVVDEFVPADTAGSTAPKRCFRVRPAEEASFDSIENADIVIQLRAENPPGAQQIVIPIVTVAVNEPAVKSAGSHN